MTPKLRVWLTPALEDHQQSFEAYREEIRHLRNSATAHGVELDFVLPNPGQIYDYSLLDALGRFAVAHVNQVIPVLTGLLGTWLGARNGRKVRLKIGDLEAEARTPEEVEKLLEKAKQIQERNQPKKIHEP